MNKQKLSQIYNKSYKLLLLLPICLMFFCIIYMYNFYNVHGDIIYKDVSLTGGTSATIQGNFSISEIELVLINRLEDINVRSVYDMITNEQKAVIIETKSSPEQTKQVLEDYLGYKLTTENSSFEYTGSTLSKNFYKQLILSLLVSFVFMSIVILIIFRSFIPSFAVIISAFADIFMTLVVSNILGIKISTAGIVAFLMLIGYSVDTDILLTNRVIKGKVGSVNQKIFGAFKTGIMMTSTAIISIAFSLIIVRSFSNTLNQIFTILLIGLFFDIFNTWITNASIIKWYVEKKQ